jgi:N-formylglutamate deformylase
MADGNKNFVLYATIPHSGEEVPDFCDWLKGLPEPILMCDVDRFVDRLYLEALQKFNLSFQTTKWHRYAADLNRVPADIDCDSVQGSANAAGLFSRGFHWSVTTLNQPLMTKPMSLEMHQKLVELIYEPFHQNIRTHYEKLNKLGREQIYHLDLHSMPSLGTNQHRDPGERRADVVVSDCKGVSSNPQFVDLVIAAYVRAGFKVAYNWPYFGGRLSEQYGRPSKGINVVQVELNRGLYMNEETKKLEVSKLPKIQAQLEQALGFILSQLS